MPRVIFTQQLARFTEVPEIDAQAATLAQALEAAFATNPRLRSYVLDEQSHLRRHVVVFVDGRRLQVRENLDVPLGPDDTVHVFQSLSGG
ncbi:MAG: MoaD/ThiS family protein [Burkholderiaceae bacterium]|nr:MoaD/ThiS family protein [Burkholderiaceae bacterium]